MKIINTDQLFESFLQGMENGENLKVKILFCLKIPWNFTSKPLLTNHKSVPTLLYFHYKMIQGPFKWRAPLGQYLFIDH